MGPVGSSPVEPWFNGSWRSEFLWTYIMFFCWKSNLTKRGLGQDKTSWRQPFLQNEMAIRWMFCIREFWKETYVGIKFMEVFWVQIHIQPSALCQTTLWPFAIKCWLVVEPTHLKNMFVKLEIFPNFRGENKKYMKPPPRIDKAKGVF